MSVIAMPAGVCGAAPASGNQSLSQIITTLGLTTNLKLCLDAGDAASYDPAVQTAKWLDTSGNGYDFYRGESGAGDGAEPTFNGTAGGLSNAEYFSLDGGDYFLYDSANETWMNALHNDGVQWSFFIMTYLPSVTVNYLIATAQPTFAPVAAGMAVMAGSGGSANLLWSCVFADGSASTNTVKTSAYTTNTWAGLGYGISENGGAGASAYLSAGGVTGTFNGNNTRAGSATPSTMTIGATSSNHLLPVSSNTRIACLAVWQGTALTATNLSDIYNAIKGRFGL